MLGPRDETAIGASNRTPSSDVTTAPRNECLSADGVSDPLANDLRLRPPSIAVDLDDQALRQAGGTEDAPIDAVRSDVGGRVPRMTTNRCGLSTTRREPTACDRLATTCIEHAGRRDVRGCTTCELVAVRSYLTMVRTPSDQDLSDAATLEARFIAALPSFSRRRRISRAALIEFGVSERILDSAGV